MEILSYPNIDIPTKRKIKALVEAGQFFLLSNHTVQLCKEKNFGMLKKNIDTYYDQVFSGILPQGK